MAEWKDVTKSMTQRLMKEAESARWKPLMNQLGLTDEEMVDRMVRMLLIHLLMDRTVTTALTVNLIKNKSEPTQFDALESELVRISLSSRIRLLKACGDISDSCALAKCMR